MPFIDEKSAPLSRMAFQALVRYKHDGQAFYGNLVRRSRSGYVVERLGGDIDNGFVNTRVRDTVTELLCPLERAPMIICLGLNFVRFAELENLPIAAYPIVFTKPPDALSGPNDPISVHPDAQSHLDYEGELCVVISRDAKNVSEADAPDYILGYAAGNDVTARNFQIPDASGGQYSYCKSFDGFAPIGPAIWSPAVIPDPHALRYRTMVNGKVVQETETSDMIWSVSQVIAHLSRGTTLRKGTVIMMGTPVGIGYSQGKFLKDGDIVAVEIDGLGKIENKIVFEKPVSQ
ncbi:fumarylacetoacetate hydrolase family protein [Colletotrichum truncatum]|uniref:Fumarylacetoacetate hydrolase family protein n=1 Tax=Colletotrichum truncatum TaxID=5467 RepID=A0ACC3ZFJ3_COLTU|nr:fumarylacetoacetate hydrolase family protein [Colletotrichum truncatum]KAF6801775.1 fumarylacetoacetate hydrolase family protein [Colletotrichum truncatum]